MGKLLRIAGIVLGIVVVVLAGLTIFVKSYLSGERLKAVIIPKLETLTGKPVTIHSMDISLFKGVVVKGLRIQEPGGGEDFARIQEFILDYSLLPLLKKQLVIKKIELVSPALFIKRRKDGTYNFSTITRQRAEEAKQEKVQREIPVALIADRVSVRNALIRFTDSLGKLPDIAADIPGMEFRASLKETLALAGRIDLRKMSAAAGRIQTSTSGKIEITEKAITLGLTTVLGRDSIRTSGTIRDYLTAPNAELNFASSHLDLDALMPPSGAGKTSLKGPERELGGNGYLVYVAAEAGKEDIRASGSVRVDEMKYSGYAIRDFSLRYRYLKGTGTLSPITMNLAGGEQVSAAGTAKGDFLFRYSPASADTVAAIENTLAGKGVADLNKVEVKSSNITRAIAFFTGIDELRSPAFVRTVFNFTVKDRIIFLDGTMDSPYIKLNPSGTAGFDKRINILAELKLSPALALKLSQRAKAAGSIRDKEGWSVIPLKISGTTDKPSVGLNPAGVGKQLQKGIQEELEKRILKGLIP